MMRQKKMMRHDENYKAWENVSLEPDDSYDEYLLKNLFVEFPFYKFIPTPNKMFYMLICMKIR